MMKNLFFASYLFIGILTLSVMGTSLSAYTASDYLGAWSRSSDSGVVRILINYVSASEYEVEMLKPNHNILSGENYYSSLGVNSVTPAIPLQYTISSSILSHTTYTLTFLSSNTIHIKQDVYSIGNVSTSYYTMTRMTQPDLIISDISVGSDFIERGEAPFQKVHFTVKNIGNSFFTNTYSLRTRIETRSTNGQAGPSSGYFSLNTPAIMSSGQEVDGSYYVGTQNNDTLGYYTHRLKVDYDDNVVEYNDDNNLSRTIDFSIVDESCIAGHIAYDGAAVNYYSSHAPTIRFRNTDTATWIYPEYYINPKTTFYITWGLPENNIATYTSLASDVMPESTYAAEGYYGFNAFDLSAMSLSEQVSQDLSVRYNIHMVKPFDNTESLGALFVNHDDYPMYSPMMVLKWKPVPRADHYSVTIGRYRTEDHPSGAGYLGQVYSDTNLPGNEISPSLNESATYEYYRFYVNAYNSSNELLSNFYTLYDNTIGSSFSFRVESNFTCYPDLPTPKLFVTDRETIGNQYVYHMTMTNASQFPDDLFTPQRQLPSCGTNDESSRTWVTIYNQDGIAVGGNCMYPSASNLRNLAISVNTASTQPEYLYVELEDRLCQNTYTSRMADATEPCPVGDLNGDCRVNLADLSLLAQNWLNENN
ncbi:MAG: hypothetical protein K9M57_00725 [Phycisphaerae bacterium]|nr:hypothetical protein [Phycisphaerae bacterium]